MSDAFPLDDTETTDTDEDGIGNKADTDDDGDEVDDAFDAFPLDATETTDTDGEAPVITLIPMTMAMAFLTYLMRSH